MGMIDEREIRKTIATLKPDGTLFEIRIIGKAGKKKVISGYFRDTGTLIKAFDTVDLKGTNVYITLNQVNDSLYSRTQRDCFRQTDNNTKDGEIDGYQWFFIDLDPIRPEGISSSDEELKAAYELARKVYLYLQGMGFEEPVKAISGNGAHLLYQVQLANNAENEALIKTCLKVVAQLFSNDVVKIDEVNFNPARICKLYGTLAQKGANTPERPHRMSRIVSVPEELKPTKRAYLEKLAAELPADEQIAPSQAPVDTEFNLEDWMSKYGLRWIRADKQNSCTIYPLEECPFDHSHTDGDSKIFHYNNGAIAFKCHHNSCRGKKWQDVRQMFEPDAYTKREDFDRRIEEGWKQHNADAGIVTAKRMQETPDEPMFLNARNILDKQEPENDYIKTGINIIDTKMGGLEKTAVSVVTGIRGSAKSTLLSEIALNVRESGGTVVCYSGELSSKNFMKWMNLQAAGKAYSIASKKYEGFRMVEPSVQRQIADWLGDHFWLYNNKFGNEFKGVAERIEQEITKRKADLCILDNLMALNLEEDKHFINSAQTEFVWRLKDIAFRCNCHIIFVAHPRKAFGFLRGDDIAGSGNLLNAADNGFIVHRANRDFRNGITQYLGERSPLIEELKDATNVIEVVKARESGLQDEFIPLYYEAESKRLKNYPVENVTYGWCEEFVEADDDLMPF